MCRGRPPISPQSSAKARQRGDAALGVGVRQLRQLLADAVRVAVGEAREPLELAERQAERLADVADRAARAVGREARDERRVLAAVALADRDDQLLADVAREVEVDVRHRGELAVEEAAEREPGPHRVDVREAGQVADDRADRAAAPAARAAGRCARREPPRTSSAHSRASSSTSQWSRKNPARPSSSISFSSSSSRLPRAALVAVRVAVALLEGAVADAGELPDRRLAGVGEVGVAVAEVLGQVELEPLGELGRARDRVAVVREALLPLRRARAARSRGCRAARARSRRARCGSGSRRARPGARLAAEWCACASPVATVWTPSASARSRSAAQPARVAALVRALQLDEEPLAPEGARQRRRAVRVATSRARAARSRRGRRAPRSARPAAPASSDGGDGSAGLARVCACAAVSSRQRFA